MEYFTGRGTSVCGLHPEKRSWGKSISNWRSFCKSMARIAALGSFRSFVASGTKAGNVPFSRLCKVRFPRVAALWAKRSIPHSEHRADGALQSIRVTRRAAGTGGYGSARQGSIARRRAIIGISPAATATRTTETSRKAEARPKASETRPMTPGPIRKAP